MFTREEVTESIKTRYASVRERGRILARALQARAAVAAVRRRLRATFSELGEHIYEALEAGRAGGRGEEPELASFQSRIKGLKAELSQREKALKDILEGKTQASEPEEAGEEPAAPGKRKATKADAKGPGGSADG